VNRERVVLALTSAEPEERRRVRAAALALGFRHFAVPPGDPGPGVEGETSTEYDGSTVSSRETGGVRRSVHAVSSPEELERILHGASAERLVVVRWKGERLLPLETLVAAKQGRFAVWIVTDEPREVPGALGALEHGADRVILEVSDTAAVHRVDDLLESTELPSLDWKEVEVTRVEPAGLGDRILVDTTSLLAESEGMVVGSSAAFLFHARSEAVGSRYTRPRPFRVNAGALHSYTLLPDGTTRYLSELQPGERVLVVTPRGRARSVRVGRIKIERRPLHLIGARAEVGERTVFLQEAETVRLSNPSSQGIATTELKVGDRVLGVALPPGRHLGRAVEETVHEQ